MPPQPKPLAERFWAKVRSGEGCWEWQGYLMKNGYGTFFIRKDLQKELVHRIAYRLTYGAIPDASLVLHRCDNRRCVRPDHLFLGTPRDNTQDMIAKQRDRWRVTGPVTHCKRGHEFTPENTYVTTRGRRGCRTCGRIKKGITVFRGPRVKRSWPGARA